MVSSRAATAAVGVAASLLVSAAAWIYFDSLLLFLVVPFVPFLFRRRGEGTTPPVKRCPRCGFETREPSFAHCPRDGAELAELAELAER